MKQRCCGHGGLTSRDQPHVCVWGGLTTNIVCHDISYIIIHGVVFSLSLSLPLLITADDERHGHNANDDIHHVIIGCCVGKLADSGTNQCFVCVYAHQRVQHTNTLVTSECFMQKLTETIPG